MPAVPERFRNRTGAVIVAAIVLVAAALGAAVAARSDDEPEPGGTAAPTTAPPATTVPTTAAPTTTPPVTAAPATAAPTTSAATPATTPSTTTAPRAVTGVPCVVELHGKGGRGGATTTAGGVTTVRPTGNAAGWNGRQWLYFPDSGYTAARQVVADAIAGANCGRVVVNGFSNGAAFAAKLYCRGESFDGRLVGVMVDDPVTDRAVEGCAPPSGVPVVLYWTGALEGQAKAGWRCADADWTCEGGTTLGITAYARALGTGVQASPNKDHAPNTKAPEPAAWARGT